MIVIWSLALGDSAVLLQGACLMQPPV